MLRLLTSLCLSILLTACSLPQSQLGLVGQSAPTVTYYLINDGPHSLSENQGKTTVLAFWLSTCPHCRHEMPKVNELAKTFADDPTISFIAISIDKLTDEKHLLDNIKLWGLSNMQLAFSANDVYDEAFLAFHGDRVPYIVLIDKTGIVRWIGNDADTLKSELIKLLH